MEERLKIIQEQIRQACDRAGRAYDCVTLIAVSKTMPTQIVAQAYEVGMRQFGENKVQELVKKQEELPSDIKWHMIGHLQRNKVKYIVGKTELIHSVDSLRLAQEISKESQKLNMTSDILLEVNNAMESTKYGFSVDEVWQTISDIAVLPNIRIKGLMTIAPYVENQEENRKYFAELRQLSVDIKAKNIDNVTMSVLSMGMTNDYSVAIEEGATHVRIGTGIFGNR